MLDGGNLSKALMNIVSNLYKYTLSCSIRVTTNDSEVRSQNRGTGANWISAASYPDRLNSMFIKMN
jgi:hypothetical protein